MTNLLKQILDFIFGIVNNYGWAVILFTLLIKCVLIPLDIRSRKSMRAMSQLAPQLDALKKKYEKDQEKLNKKTQELYKKNHVNPLSGCLPLLIQFPILWCMFSAMRKAADEQHILQMLEWVKTMVVSGEGAEATLMPLSEVKAAISNGTIAAAPTFDGWLWIKNVFQADSFAESFMPSAQQLNQAFQSVQSIISENDAALLNKFLESELFADFEMQYGSANLANFKNFGSFLGVTARWPMNWSLANGYLILPILAGVTQYLSTLLQPEQTGSTDTQQQQNGTGKFMKYFFPIFSVWICLSSTAAFAIYWVFVNVFSIASSWVINKVLEAQDKKNEVKEAVA